jgi:hypothetical protein
MFIVTTVQHIMIGDLSGLPSRSAEEEMDIDRQTQVLDGSGETYVLSKNDERALVRDSTVGFSGEYSDSYRGLIQLIFRLLSFHRLGHFSVSKSIGFIRKSPRRRREEEHHWR